MIISTEQWQKLFTFSNFTGQTPMHHTLNFSVIIRYHNISLFPYIEREPVLLIWLQYESCVNFECKLSAICVFLTVANHSVNHIKTIFALQSSPLFTIQVLPSKVSLTHSTIIDTHCHRHEHKQHNRAYQISWHSWTNLKRQHCRAVSRGKRRALAPRGAQWQRCNIACPVDEFRSSINEN